MKCLEPAQIARVLSLELEDPHIGECLVCRRRLEADRVMRDALRSLPTPALSVTHKRALAAETIARAQLQQQPLRRPRRSLAAVAAVAAFAALAAGVAITVSRPELASDAPVVSASDDTSADLAMSGVTVQRELAPPALASPAIEATHGAAYVHTVGAERDVIALADGIMTLDSRNARNVDVRVGDTAIRVDQAVVAIRVHARKVISVRVVVGAARVEYGGEQMVLQRDALWTPPPSVQVRSLAAFRDGWTALRAGQNLDAMALFDRVTDPVAREEASYWAAVAARRAGDPSAAARLANFLQAFPQSPYADDLRDR